MSDGWVGQESREVTVGDCTPLVISREGEVRGGLARPCNKVLQVQASASLGCPLLPCPILFTSPISKGSCESMLDLLNCIIVIFFCVCKMCLSENPEEHYQMPLLKEEAGLVSASTVVLFLLLNETSFAEFIL
ncbi:hypothetical protein INR49_009224 [Caranx melampygus]|nr:hypothetical protein INR49_009224 [Caranx melampygus]